MSFTDDDLKRFKEMIEPGRKGHPEGKFAELTEFFLFRAEALLARLEAAEELPEELESEHWHFIDSLYSDRSKHSVPDCRVCLKLDKWRKAAGK